MGNVVKYEGKLYIILKVKNNEKKDSLGLNRVYKLVPYEIARMREYITEDDAIEVKAVDFKLPFVYCNDIAPIYLNAEPIRYKTMNSVSKSSKVSFIRP